MTVLEFARRNAGLTRAQLASLVGTSPSTIGVYESAATSKAWTLAKRLAAELGLDPASIMDREEVTY